MTVDLLQVARFAARREKAGDVEECTADVVLALVEAAPGCLLDAQRVARWAARRWVYADRVRRGRETVSHAL